MKSKDVKFVTLLLKWFEFNKRTFSWRTLKLTPFQLLVAEMMLQKTNAKQVEKMFENFILKHPDAKSMIEIEEESLAEELQPLGLFNRRARDMKKTAQVIMDENNEIPKTRKDLMRLPGVGDYIANAILCFSFNKRVPIIDANVGRVIKRLYSFPVKGAPSRDKSLAEKMSKIIPKQNFKEFNYAILDLAALLCLSRNPHCSDCPLNSICDFFKDNK
jgi:A/G-specific adenine glycosylase